MRILFLSDNFPPEVNAPATRTYEHCIEWVKAGHEVTVITCFPNFPQGKVFDGYKNKLYQVEDIDGIKVIRVWSYISANKGFVKRILDYFSYAVSAFFAGLNKKADIIIATSPQFFTAVSGSWLSFVKRTPWVMEVRDLWPESIKSVGAMNGDSKVFKFLEAWEKALYKVADSIVVVTDTFKEVISKRGIDPKKIFVVKNGVDLTKFKPIEKDKELLSQYSLDGKFLIGYIGTHGMAHALDFVLKTASKIDDKQIHFLLIGDGAEKAKLVQLKNEMSIDNVTMLPFQPKTEIRRYIGLLDVALVNLKKTDTFKTVIPSKIFENASMLKPILLGVDGESRGIVERYNAGIAFEPENEKAFMEAIDKLKKDKTTYLSLQEGCNNLANDFDRKKLALDMLNIIEN